MGGAYSHSAEKRFTFFSGKAEKRANLPLLIKRKKKKKGANRGESRIHPEWKRGNKKQAFFALGHRAPILVKRFLTGKKGKKRAT